LPVRGRLERYLGKAYKGFSRKQALEMMRITGENVKVADEIIRQLKDAGLVGDNIKFSVKYWRHSFGLQYYIEKYTCGAIRYSKGGGHTNPKMLKLVNVIKKNGFIDGKIRNMKKGKFKFTPKTAYLEGNYEKLGRKIKASFKNIKDVKKSRNGNIVFETITDCGLRLRNVIDKFGNLISTFPID